LTQALLGFEEVRRGSQNRSPQQFKVMAIRFEKLSSVWFGETQADTLGGGRVVVCNERAGLVVRSFVPNRGRRSFGELVVARIPREGVVLKVLAGGGRRASRVAGLPLADEHREAEAGSLNPKDILTSDLNPLHSKKDGGKSSDSGTEDDSGDEDGEPTASPAPWMSEEEAKTVVSEVILKGEDLSVIEYSGNGEAQPDDAHPLKSMVDSFVNKGNGDGRGFSLSDVGGFWKTGEDAGELKVPEISVSGFDVKDGVSPLAQWTSTELTMQHSQLARIVTDVFYMQIAFGFFGGVRIVEALFSVFSTSPPDLGKLKELLNALDPFTISWLANNVREPLEDLMNADPMDLEKVVTLKSSVWQALHAFYERQWKVVSCSDGLQTLENPLRIVKVSVNASDQSTSCSCGFPS
jgi:hypothetical protein